MFREYLNFDIHIGVPDGRRYHLHVSGPGGEAKATLTLPPRSQIYQQSIARLERQETDLGSLETLGESLFRSLFRGQVKEVYVRSQGTLKPHQGLRLCFHFDPQAHRVASVPWEFLFDPDQGPLALIDAPVVRYLHQQRVIPALMSPLPLRILVTKSAPLPEKRMQEEFEEVQRALTNLGTAIHIETEPQLTRQQLMRRLREGYHIWHFIGQGGVAKDGKDAVLLFEGSTGGIEQISALELGVLLRGSHLRLVVLDASDSGRLLVEPFRSIAPALIRAHIPAVVAMQLPTAHHVTRVFAEEFYRALAEGFPIDACVTEGRKSIMGVTGLGRPD